MQKQFLPDYWGINIKGTSVWSYFRFNHNRLPTSQYKAQFKLSWNDITYFFRLLLLRFSKAEVVIFLAARNDLLSLLNSEPFVSKKTVIFLREDGHGVPGNVFIIEAFRYLFRLLSCVLFYRSFKDLQRQLNLNGLDLNVHNGSIKAAVGDFYFNKILSFFLKGKVVYFSNCVVPKIERVQLRSNSIEIQHGVIHDLHPDYAKIPKEFFKSPLLCWGDFWKRKIINVGFCGTLIVGPVPLIKKPSENYTDSVCFFTTVNEHISYKIIDCIKQLGNVNALLQMHPRDRFDYEISLDNILTCKGLSPLEVLWPVMHDSTLAYVCAENKKKFIYLAGDNENTDEIIKRLLEKYNASHEDDYYIAYSARELACLISRL
ncbi:hypothetical protein [Pseudoalteromonas sp. NZS11]|uniref:hypothetical protein n=1 Tax=Pseudoalteromonas sp. NZS11 TaxID=2792049 RepID=UPI0018CF14DD|nr:hypothetical protein [Pseudoalteromonas sp. NZS11]MBH0078185.1 hypothetical protein [Pseudoalteromonas sp. NZS11]